MCLSVGYFELINFSHYFYVACIFQNSLRLAAIKGLEVPLIKGGPLMKESILIRKQKRGGGGERQLKRLLIPVTLRPSPKLKDAARVWGSCADVVFEKNASTGKIPRNAEFKTAEARGGSPIKTHRQILELCLDSWEKEKAGALIFTQCNLLLFIISGSGRLCVFFSTRHSRENQPAFTY